MEVALSPACGRPTGEHVVAGSKTITSIVSFLPERFHRACSMLFWNPNEIVCGYFEHVVLDNHDDEMMMIMEFFIWLEVLCSWTKDHTVCLLFIICSYSLNQPSIYTSICLYTMLSNWQHTIFMPAKMFVVFLDDQMHIKPVLYTSYCLMSKKQMNESRNLNRNQTI